MSQFLYYHIIIILVTLQRDLLVEKDRHLTELRTSVVELVETMVKEGFKSHRDVLRESCTALSSKLQSDLKTVMKSVVEEAGALLCLDFKKRRKKMYFVLVFVFVIPVPRFLQLH